MQKRKLGMVLALAGVLVVAPVAAAGATTVAVGGGLWTYGVDWQNVFSNYHHSTKYHSATACSSSWDCRQVSAAPGAWANASKYRSIADNSAYWNTY